MRVRSRFGELLNEDNQVTGVVLNAWDGFYAGRPFIDQVVFHYYETPEAAYQAYQEGDLLGISYIDPQLLPTVLSDPVLNVYSARLPRLSLTDYLVALLLSRWTQRTRPQ